MGLLFISNLIFRVRRHLERADNFFASFDGQVVVNIKDGLFPMGVSALRG